MCACIGKSNNLTRIVLKIEKYLNFFLTNVLEIGFARCVCAPNKENGKKNPTLYTYI